MWYTAAMTETKRPVTLHARKGTRVAFQPNPVSRLLYGGRLPAVGEVGEVAPVSFGSYGRTFLPGPGGGLLYVKWPSIGTCGVSPIDLVRA